MTREILTHDLMSEQLTACLAAILNILVFKMAQMVVLYLDFIICSYNMNFSIVNFLSVQDEENIPVKVAVSRDFRPQFFLS